MQDPISFCLSIFLVAYSNIKQRQEKGDTKKKKKRKEPKKKARQKEVVETKSFSKIRITEGIEVKDNYENAFFRRANKQIVIIVLMIITYLSNTRNITIYQRGCTFHPFL